MRVADVLRRVDQLNAARPKAKRLDRVRTGMTCPGCGGPIFEGETIYRKDAEAISRRLAQGEPLPAYALHAGCA